MVTFLGMVRDRNRDAASCTSNTRRYEPLALRALERIVEEAAETLAGGARWRCITASAG